MIHKKIHFQAIESLEDASLLKGELSPIGNGRGGSGQRDFAVILCEQFSENATHIIMVIVVDNNFLESVGLPTAFQQLAVGVQKIIGREDGSIPWNRLRKMNVPRHRAARLRPWRG